MSRAFVKEDVDPPERSSRRRSLSGLPPGAANYITAEGRGYLQRELDNLRREAGASEDRVAELEQILASATVADGTDDPSTIAFGAKVTVRDAANQIRSYRIVGVDEVRFYSDGTAWITPVAKALLAAEVGDWVTLDNDEKVEIVQVDYPRG